MRAYIPMIVILRVIAAGIGGIFLISKNYYKLSCEKARKIEIFGYYILFVVLIWELILKNVFMEDFYGADLSYIDQKLDYLFMALKQMGSDGRNISEAIEKGFWDSKVADFTKNQLLFTDFIEAILKISSTVCIAVGRFYELSKREKE